MRQRNSSPHHWHAFSQADLASIGGLLLFVLSVSAVESLLRPTFTPLSLVLTGVGMSLVPAVVWLAFFYRRDRLDPEPKGLVFRVFLLGGLLAGAVGIPLVEDVFAVQTWLYHDTLTQILGGILVIGFTQEFLKFAAVRFAIYDSVEFDEPLDGIIYATAAGVGYATVLNIAFIVQSGGADLSAACIRIVFTALAHASFAGVSGYFTGLTKFARQPSIWWLPAGVSMAAVLNGIFFYLRGELAKGGANLSNPSLLSPWGGLALAIALTIIITTMLSRAMAQQTITEE